MDFTRRATDAYAIPHEAPIRDVGVASPVPQLNRDAVPSSAQHFSLQLYLILVFLVSIFPTYAQSGGDARTPSPAHPQLREPTGADRCRFCHAAEVQGYSRSAMALLCAVLVKNQTASSRATERKSRFILLRRVTGRVGRIEAIRVPTALTL